MSAFVSYLVDAFTPIGCALAVLGAWVLLRHRFVEGLALLVAFAVSGPAFLAFANVYFADALVRGVVARFYILPSIPFAVFIGAGSWWLVVETPGGRPPQLDRGTGMAASAQAGCARDRARTRRGSCRAGRRAREPLAAR